MSDSPRILGTEPRVAVLALAAALVSCAPSRIPEARITAVSPSGDVAAVRAAVATFVLAECAGDVRADTLLLPGADFIVTGVPVTRRPRLAGVPGPGTGSVEEFRAQVIGETAWAVAVYRWLGQSASSAERGVATVVLERRRSGWRIRHLHSSHVARWGP